MLLRLSSLLSIAFILFSINSASSQLLDPEPKYKVFDESSGLPSTETYKVFEDRSGYIWILSDKGVSRFDGYRFKVFTTDDGLQDNVNFDCVEDQKGRLWFVGFNGKLTVYQDGKMKPYKYADRIVNLFKISRIPFVSLIINPFDGITLIYKGLGAVSVSENGIVTRIDSNLKSHHTIVNLENQFFIYSKIPKEWVVTTVKEKVNLFLKNKNKTVLLGEIDSGYDTRFTRFKNTICFIENRELYQVRNNKLFKIPLDKAPISIYSKGDYLYIGLLRGGVIQFKMVANNKLEIHATFINQFSVSSVLVDNEKGKWFSTLESGIFYVSNVNYSFLDLKHGLADKSVLSICGLKNKVLIGYYSGHWQEITYPFRQINYGESFGNNKIVSFGGKLFIQNTPNKSTSISYINDKNKFEAYYKTDSLLYFYEGKISVINKKGQEVQKFNYIKNEKQYQRFNSFYVSDIENIYFGNRFGLFKYKNRQEAQHFPPNKLFNVRVESMKHDPNWDCVVATRGSGIYFLKNGRVTGTITKINGLLDNQVTALYIDDQHRIWVASNGGLDLITGNKKNYFIRHFSKRNGLKTNQISDIYVYKNKVWLATKEGVAIIELNSDEVKSDQFQVMVESVNDNTNWKNFKLFEHEIPLIKILLRSTNFKGCNTHKFKYRFSKNQPWILSDIPEIILNSPSSGKYNLELLYLNETENWVPSKLIYSFEIDTSIWVKWYSIVIYVFLIVAFVMFFTRIRINQINRKNRYESRMNLLEQKALSAQMNPHFMFNALNSIQSFLLFRENDQAEKYLLKFSQLMRQTLSNSRDHYITIDQELLILNNYIELEQMRFKNKFDYEIKVDLSASARNYFIPPMMIQPYVENAIIHGLANRLSGAQLDLNITLDENGYLSVFIVDNGVGIEQAAKNKRSNHRSFGTQITEERMRVFGAKFGKDFDIAISAAYENTEFPGTLVQLKIPILKEYEPDKSNDY